MALGYSEWLWTKGRSLYFEKLQIDNRAAFIGLLVQRWISFIHAITDEQKGLCHHGCPRPEGQKERPCRFGMQPGLPQGKPMKGLPEKVILGIRNRWPGRLGVADRAREEFGGARYLINYRRYL